MKFLEDFFEYFALFVLLINSILYAKRYKRLKTFIAFSYFVYYLSTSLVILLVSDIFAFLKLNNLFISHFYFLSQFLFLSLFYKSLFNHKQQKLVTFILILVLLSLTIQYNLQPELFSKFNILEIFLCSFPLIIYAIIHLYNSLTQKGTYMYINAGVLIYISTSTLIFILGDYLSQFSKSQVVKNIWLINKILYVVYLFLILIEWKKNLSQIKKL